MKNLPEEDFWKEVGTRLSNYQEDPGNDWENISPGINSNSIPVSWMMRGGHLFTVAGLVSLLWLVFLLATTDSIQQYPLEPSGMVSTAADSAGIKDTKSGAANKQYKSEDETSPLSRKTTEEKKMSVIKTLKEEDVDMSGHSRSHIVVEAQDKKSGSSITVGPDDVYSNSTFDISLEEKSTNNEIPLTSIEPIALPDVVADSSLSNPIEVKDENKRKKAHHKPVVYFSIAPSLAYQKLIPLKNDQVTILHLNSADIFSSDRFGVAIEAGVQFMIARKWEMFTGFSYYSQNQTISYVFRSPEVTSIEETPEDLSYTLTPGSAVRIFHYRMSNAGATVGLLYNLKGDKLQHKIGGGIQYQKGLHTASEEETYDNSRSTYVNYQLLYRFEYLFTKQLRIYIQPGFTHAIHSSESLKEPFQIKPYRAGIAFGVLYDF